MNKPKVLIVDDDPAVLDMLQQGLERDGFDVVASSSVRDAIKQIAGQTFDVLLSDLHMPQAGDGFTVVSAMRHTHPNALTLVLSGYPALDEAMSAILSQADEVLVKPLEISTIRKLIRDRLADPQSRDRNKIESVATILERESEQTIANWLALVERDQELNCITLTRQERTGHLPKLIRDLIMRLRLDVGSAAPLSIAARDHGEMRCKQGYTAPMLVEESRIFQVSIFSTLQRNLIHLDFSKVLTNVVTIADEVDSQLKQAMRSFITPTEVVKPPVLSLVQRAGNAGK
jgi:ActR/RegA family two-component response regulator